MKNLLSKYHLPLTIPHDITIHKEEIIRSVKSDKKVINGKVRFVLLSEIGKGFVCEDVTDDEISKAIGSIL